MDKPEINQYITDFLNTDESNFVSAEKARIPEYAGLRFFGDPIIGYASADDDYLNSLIHNADAGVDLMHAKTWLHDAKTIISWFLPFTEMIKALNRAAKDKPSDLWQQARVNGEECLKKLADSLAAKLKKEGCDAVAPIADVRMILQMDFDDIGSKPFNSNWSERHIAYAAGIGTFSLSKGIITEKGMAGRLASVVTSLVLEPTERPYTDLYEYCTLCGACVRRCPANAISMEAGKNHDVCARYLKSVTSPGGAFYGCGMCQCKVPCESIKPYCSAD